LSHKPLTMDFAEAGLLKSLWLGNVICFAVLSAGALMLAPWPTALSVMVGGAIALVNYRLLQRNVCRILLGGDRQGMMGKVLVKYYLRFAATALVLWILVRQEVVEPLGLLVGLSVVVVTIFVWAGCQVRKLSKEAV